ncbi:SHOCT domain-containing protein [Pseudarthrobacter sp. ATCC 49987]|uniref:SHOCT domain-containing protein n=1 Tax=Pseudarthrobacter sp. ATCC 49987 TaxID=2698204 RepID=UPI001F34F424|nr:SHOCT domain-containing protein [Pseudarthrobacter sp. ATCC 49987]
MGLLRGMARTAVVAGTASAVSGRVQRRQAAKFADKDAATAAKQQQAYDQQMGQQQQAAYQQPAQPPPPPPAAAGGITNDAIEQLKELAALKEQGILTEQEFGAQKAKILGG